MDVKVRVILSLLLILEDKVNAQTLEHLNFQLQNLPMEACDSMTVSYSGAGRGKRVSKNIVLSSLYFLHKYPSLSFRRWHNQLAKFSKFVWSEKWREIQVSNSKNVMFGDSSSHAKLCGNIPTDRYCKWDQGIQEIFDHFHGHFGCHSDAKKNNKFQCDYKS